MDDSLRAHSWNNPEGSDSLIDVIRQARALDLAGKSSLQLWTRALALAPNEIDAKIGYVGAGGFFAEEIRDEFLGRAWKLTNLPVNDDKWNLIYGKFVDTMQTGPVGLTVDEHFAFSIAGPDQNSGGLGMASALTEGSLDLAMYEHKDHPALHDAVNEYARTTINQGAWWRTIGKLTYGPREEATLETITLARTVHSRTVIVPSFFTGHDIYLTPRLSPNESRTSPNSESNPLPYITELFGKNWARTIPAMQYFQIPGFPSSPCEIILRTDSDEIRNQHRERSLILSEPFLVNLLIQCENFGRPDPAVYFRKAERVN